MSHPLDDVPSLAEIIPRLGDDEFRLLQQIAARLLRWQTAYGSLNLRKDTRNVFAETKEELFDSCAYLAMTLALELLREEKRESDTERPPAVGIDAHAWAEGIRLSIQAANPKVLGPWRKGAPDWSIREDKTGALRARVALSLYHADPVWNWQVLDDHPWQMSNRHWLISGSALTEEEARRAADQVAAEMGWQLEDHNG
jgi:hypothetical protein